MSAKGGQAVRAPVYEENDVLNQLVEGLVVKAISGFYTVQTSQGAIVCQLPGRLKQEWQLSSIVAVGDQVTISLNADGSGVIEAVTPRHAALSRARPRPTPAGYCLIRSKSWWQIQINWCLFFL
ncbi:MAG: hypothetical protein M5U34_48715 [Chloroflexi bacterium]|nr:hypothetical protein [Chloroflexota bacterium]